MYAFECEYFMLFRPYPGMKGQAGVRNATHLQIQKHSCLKIFRKTVYQCKESKYELSVVQGNWRHEPLQL